MKGDAGVNFKHSMIRRCDLFAAGSFWIAF